MNKNSLFAILLIFLAGCLLLLACQTSQSSIFSNQCGAPCWRGIEPGKTHMQDALKLIKNFRDIDAKSIDTSGRSWYIFSDVINFKLTSGEDVTVYMLNDFVALISFTNHKGIAPFEKIIRTFGDPEYVARSSLLGQGLPILPASDTIHPWFFALNPSKGIAFGYDTYNVWFGSNFNLTSNTMISDFQFFDTQKYDKLLTSGFLVYTDGEFSKERLYPWKGYGDINQLYPK